MTPEPITRLINRSSGHTLYVRCPVVTGSHQVMCSACDDYYQTPYDNDMPLPIGWLVGLEEMHRETVRLAAVHPLALAVWAEKYPGEPYPSEADATEWELMLSLRLQDLPRPGGG